MQKQENLIRDILTYYLKYWPYFLLSLFLSLTLCILYLRYTPKGYMIVTKIMITDEKKGKIATTTIYDDLGIVTSSNIDNEIEVLKSRSLMRLVVESLGYNISYYYTEKKMINKEEILDKDLPYIVKINQYINSGEFSISKSLDTNFNLKIRFSDTILYVKENIPFYSNIGAFTIIPNKFMTLEDSIIVKIKDPTSLPLVSVKAVNKTSSIVELSTVTTNSERGKQILKELINVYNKQTVENKNEISVSTLKFIDARLDSIASDLYIAESKVELYKKDNRLTNIENEGKMATLSSDEYSKRITDTEIQRSILSMIRDYVLNTKEENKVIPFDIGIKDPIIIDLIQKYNDLLLKSSELRRSVKDKNPLLIDINEKILIIKKNLLNSISNTENSLTLIIDELDKEENKFIQKLVDLPTQEKEYEIFQRQKTITEASYRYLIQKKEETTLTLAMTIPNAVIIDAAYKEPSPVTPKRNMVFLFGIILGIMIPPIGVYILNLIDKRVRNKREVFDVITVPILEEIPLKKIKKDFIINNNDNSVLAESFRKIAVDIYTISKKENKKVINVTSTTSNEEKLGIAVNTALFLAEIGEKVLLLDADLRSLKLNQFLKIKPKIDLTEFLTGDQYNISDIILNSEDITNVDIILSNNNVSNPMSYLNSIKMETLIQDLCKIYDYIVIDSTPINSYADSFIINRFTDYTLYGIRINQTLKRSLFQMEKLYHENKLNNMYCILLN